MAKKDLPGQTLLAASISVCHNANFHPLPTGVRINITVYLPAEKKVGDYIHFSLNPEDADRLQQALGHTLLDLDATLKDQAEQARHATPSGKH